MVPRKQEGRSIIIIIIIIIVDVVVIVFNAYTFLALCRNNAKVLTGIIH